MVHLDVEGPTLAHEHELAALVRANVIISSHSVLLLDESARVDAWRDILLTEFLSLEFIWSLRLLHLNSDGHLLFRLILIGNFRISGDLKRA